MISTEPDTPEQAVHDKQQAQDNALCTQWKQKIQLAKAKRAPDIARMKRLRKLAAGIGERDHLQDDGGEGTQNRVNLIHSTIHAMLPHIYARMPEVSIQPKESITPDEYPWLRSFAQTLEILLGEMLDVAQLKRHAKTAVRRSLSESVAWAKVGWQRDIRTDPAIIQRINDAQDNVVRLERLIAETEEDTGDTEAQLLEMREMIKALEAQKEVEVSSGLVIDLERVENIILDPSVESWEDWDKSRYIIHELRMPLELAKERFPDAAFSGATTDNATELKPITRSGADGNTQEQMIDVWEVWDKGSMTVYTLSDKAAGWVREPYQPEVVAESWYPFEPLALDVTDGRFFPLSLPEQLEVLQQEYLDTRDKYAKHRERSIPGLIFDSTLVNPETAKRLSNNEIVENIPVDTNGRPLNTLADFLKYPPIDPALYDTGQIRYDVELMSGLQDAQRGAVSKAKTATEAEIMQSGLSSRVTERQDAVETWIERIAEKAVEMALLTMTKAEVQQIAGKDAVFPELSRKQAYQKIRVRIRAGTSGKPDKISDQKAWSTILPVIQEQIPQYMQLQQQVFASQAQGNVMMAQLYRSAADTVRELLAETLRRLDERFDIDRLLPKMDTDQQQGGQAFGAFGVLPETQQSLPPIDDNVLAFNQAQTDDLNYGQ